MKKEKFTVTGMTCSACSARVQRAVSGLEGVSEVQVNLLTNSMSVDYDSACLDGWVRVGKLCEIPSIGICIVGESDKRAFVGEGTIFRRSAAWWSLQS